MVMAEEGFLKDQSKLAPYGDNPKSFIERSCLGTCKTLQRASLPSFSEAGHVFSKNLLQEVKVIFKRSLGSRGPACISTKNSSPSVQETYAILGGILFVRGKKMSGQYISTFQVCFSHLGPWFLLPGCAAHGAQIFIIIFVQGSNRSQARQHRPQEQDPADDKLSTSCLTSDLHRAVPLKIKISAHRTERFHHTCLHMKPVDTYQHKELFSSYKC